MPRANAGRHIGEGDLVTLPEAQLRLMGAPGDERWLGGRRVGRSACGHWWIFWHDGPCGEGHDDGDDPPAHDLQQPRQLGQTW